MPEIMLKAIEMPGVHALNFRGTRGSHMRAPRFQGSRLGATREGELVLVPCLGFLGSGRLGLRWGGGAAAWAGGNGCLPWGGGEEVFASLGTGACPQSTRGLVLAPASTGSTRHQEDSLKGV